MAKPKSVVSVFIGPVVLAGPVGDVLVFVLVVINRIVVEVAGAVAIAVAAPPAEAGVSRITSATSHVRHS
jgi:hypothetical protein